MNNDDDVSIEAIGDESIELNTGSSSSFIEIAWALNYIEQTQCSSLLEVYSATTPNSKHKVEFYIFFEGEEENFEYPEWYPANVEHDMVYCIIDGTGQYYKQLFAINGIDDLKKIAIDYQEEFI